MLQQFLCIITTVLSKVKVGENCKHIYTYLVNFLGHITASRCEGFPTFRQLTTFPPSGCAGGLVVTNPSHQFCLYQTTSTPKTDSSVLFLPNHQHTLKTGKESVAGTSGNLNISTRLSA